MVRGWNVEHDRMRTSALSSAIFLILIILSRFLMRKRNTRDQPDGRRESLKGKDQMGHTRPSQFMFMTSQMSRNPVDRQLVMQLVAH